jgi:CBS domain-containing protein
MTTLTPPRLAHVHAADAMHPGVLTCTRDTPLSEVARIMAAHRVHCVVVDAPGATRSDTWAVISDRDLVAMAAVDDLDEPTAAIAAGTAVPHIAASESLMRAAQMMSQYEVSHLVVVGDQSGRPEGILSTLDIATVLAARRPAPSVDGLLGR